MIPAQGCRIGGTSHRMMRDFVMKKVKYVIHIFAVWGYNRDMAERVPITRAC